MKHVVTMCAALLLALPLGPDTGEAQAAADTAVVSDTGAVAVDDSAAKKGGLWGKAKKVAGNKVVKAVAKTAACTMVPGGQAIAGAIDAASANSAGEAAQGAAGAATGTSCMPGMGGAAGAAGVGAMGAMPGGLGALPPGMEAYGAGMTAATMSRAGGAGVGPGASEADIAAAMQQAIANAQAAQQRMGATGAAMPGGMEMPGMEAPGMGVPPMGAPGMGAPGGVTEAPGQLPKLAADPVAELAKGRTAVRGIDWMANGGTVSPAAQAAFDQAITTLAKAMGQAGGKYRLELYMDDRYNDLALKMYGPPRLQLVRSMLDTAQPGLDLQIGKVKRNNDARVEIVRR